MKMKDAAGKASTSLAITEKCQAPRPKGCAGIFFQLFDWHRRFAKKKLFSRKLLPPPARAKQPGRSFKGDEKMPVAKLHYIADENKGGFPNLRKSDIMALEQKHEMKSPGLVARLMGLESMPTTRREKLKKSAPCESFGGKACNNGLEIDELMNLEKGQTRHDRPQKLQKTGLCERQAVTSFGAEALQIKSVLTRSRKHNHLKGASPLKSPRFSSSSRSVSRTSRLMIDAATRMLDPKNRTKCALTYVSQVHYGSHSEVIIEEQSTGQSSSCKKCGTVLDLQQNVEEDHQPLEDYVFSTSSKQGCEINREEKIFCKRRQEEPLPVRNNDDISFEQWCLRSERSTSKKDGSSSSSSSFTSKSSHEEHNQVALGGVEILSSAKLVALKNRKAPSARNSVSAPKDFVALNRSLSGQGRPRIPIKAENSKADGMRKSRVCRDDSPTQIRKIRAVNDNMASTVTKPRKVDTFINRKDMAYEKEVTSKGNNVGGKSGVISFTFNAPMKNKGGSSVDKRMGKRDSESRELIVDGSEKKESLRKQLGLRGDALGALLEQKLKELTSQEDYEELNNANANPKRTTAMILQELIAALTADPLLSQDTHVVESQNKAVQVKVKKEGIVGEVNSDTNRFSPGSVLDASLSCNSSSFNDSSSGLNLKPDSSTSQALEDTDNDVLDCGTSGRTSRDKVINLIVSINNLFSQLYLAGVRLEGSKLIHAKEINLHTQLLFSSDNSSSEDYFIINPGLLDELSCIIINDDDDLLLDGKEVRKEFVFDCVLECLESKYQPCSEFGYWRWRRLPGWLSAETLMGDVEAGVKKWRGLSEMSVDEMIEWEMSHSLGKWVDFDMEAFEKGIDIEEDILQNMLQQLVADLF